MLNPVKKKLYNSNLADSCVNPGALDYIDTSIIGSAESKYLMTSEDLEFVDWVWKALDPGQGFEECLGRLENAANKTLKGIKG